MTAITIRAGMATVNGECKRMNVNAAYPSTDGPQVVCLFVTVDDPGMVCELQEAIGEACENRETNVPELSAVDDRSHGHPDRSGHQTIIEQVREQLDKPELIVEIPRAHILALLSAYDTARAQLDIERRRINEK